MLMIAVADVDLCSSHLACDKRLQPPWIVNSTEVPAEQCTSGTSHPPHSPLLSPVVLVSTPELVDSTPDIEVPGQLPPEQQGILHSRKKCSLVPRQFPPSNPKLEVGRPWNEVREGIVDLKPKLVFCKAKIRSFSNLTDHEQPI